MSNDEQSKPAADELMKATPASTSQDSEYDIDASEEELLEEFGVLVAAEYRYGIVSEAVPQPLQGLQPLQGPQPLQGLQSLVGAFYHQPGYTTLSEEEMNSRFLAAKESFRAELELE